MSWFSDKRLVTTLVLCGSFLLFALVATSSSDDTIPTTALSGSAADGVGEQEERP